jgi:UDP-N-acetylmuramate dehydrogenase
MYDELREQLPEDIFLLNEPMKNHTTFKIGGPVDLMVNPRQVEEIQTVLGYCSKYRIPFLVLGVGSNLLVRDKGIRGIVIELGHHFKAMRIEGDQIWAQAGIRLSELAKKAAAHALCGLEFAEGIPGSLGGAVVMNAGAYDGEMKDVIIEVEAINPAGEIQVYTADELGFAYRKSNFQDEPYTVLSARMQLSYGMQDDIYNKMQHFARSRREKQPLEYASAGSTFKRPPGFFVGPMVEELALKGFSIGGAQVSSKHAGFIINTGDATAADVLALIHKIQTEAKAKFGVDLHPEIRIVGEE